MKLHVNALALATMLAAGSVLAADTPPQRVDARDCDVENLAQPPYPGSNWSWTSTEHRDYCVRHHREQGNDALADKLQQHEVSGEDG